MSELTTILEEQNVAKENAQQLLTAFGAPFEEAGAILSNYKDIVVTKEDQVDIMAKARNKRLELKKIRVAVENKRKELKQDSIRTGRAIDSIANKVKSQIEPAEAYLELQEKFAEVKRAERDAKVKADRIEKLSVYADDLSLYTLDNMTDEQFDNLISTLKAQAEAEEARLKKEEAERVAAEKAEQERQAKIEAENAKLRKEAEQAEIKREIERKIEAAKQAELQAEAQKQIDQEREAARVERERREAIEAEQLAKDKAEANKQAEAQEAERQALLSPDKDKLKAFANALDMIRTDKLPAVKTKQAQDIVNYIETILRDLSDEVTAKSRQL